MLTSSIFLYVSSKPRLLIRDCQLIYNKAAYITDLLETAGLKETAD